MINQNNENEEIIESTKSTFTINDTLLYILNNIELFFDKYSLVSEARIKIGDYSLRLYNENKDPDTSITFFIRYHGGNRYPDDLGDIVVALTFYREDLDSPDKNGFNKNVFMISFENNRYGIRGAEDCIRIPCTEEEYFMKSLKGTVYDYNEYVAMTEIKSKVQEKINAIDPSVKGIFARGHDGYLSTTQLEELITEFWKKIDNE